MGAGRPVIYMGQDVLDKESGEMMVAVALLVVVFHLTFLVVFLEVSFMDLLGDDCGRGTLARLTAAPNLWGNLLLLPGTMELDVARSEAGTCEMESKMLDWYFTEDLLKGRIFLEPECTDSSTGERGVHCLDAIFLFGRATEALLSKISMMVPALGAIISPGC